MGPPGKPGFEGGLGPLGNTGPRGMAVQGKMVGNILSFKFLLVYNCCNHGTYLNCCFHIFPFRVPPVQGGKREILGDQASR